MELVDSKVINRNVGKDLLILVLTEDNRSREICRGKQLGMISDTDMIDKVVQEVLVEFSKSVEEYKEGNQKVFGFLVGQTMRKLGGKANPQLINSLLKKHLS